MTDLSALLSTIYDIDPAANAIEHQSSWSSWEEMKRSIESLTSGLDSLSCGEHTRVGLMLRNRPPQVSGLLGTISSNRCLVTLNPLLPDEKLIQDITALKLPVVVGQTCDLEREGVREALDSAGSAIIALPDRLGEDIELVKSTISSEESRRTQEGVAVEMLTSGTTGTPKRIPLSRKRLELGFASAMNYESGRSADDKPRLREGTVLISAPLSHISGVWHTINTFIAGRKACIIEKFTVDEWVDAVLRHRPKVVSCPPSALRMLLDADLPADVFSSFSVLRTGTAPVSIEIVDEFLSRYDLPVLQTYGATEFAGSIAGWTLKDFRSDYQQKKGSVGRLNPGIEGRIVSFDDGSILAAGEEGVLEIRGGQLGKDWVRTTDRAVLDDDNYLWIKGRADNVIIRGGFKIHAEDVINALHKHPAIREAAVVGIPDRRLGEVPAAAIILKEDCSTPDDKALSDFLRNSLMPYQVPTKFHYMDDLPRTPSMKPSLPELKKLFAKEDGGG